MRGEMGSAPGHHDAGKKKPPIDARKIEQLVEEKEVRLQLSSADFSPPNTADTAEELSGADIIESHEIPKPAGEVTSESIVSPLHPDRNEDAVLGDRYRIAHELANPPVLKTSDVARDLAAVRRAGETELRLSSRLDERQVHAVFDGMSGKKENGSGYIASRLTSASIAEVIAEMPIDANAEMTRQSFENALMAAHQTVSEYKVGKGEEFADMGTTADLIRTIETEHAVVVGHIGDGRVYHFDSATGRLAQKTEDDGAAKYLRDRKQIDQEDFDRIMNASGVGDFDDNENTTPAASEKNKKLRYLFRKRNELTSTIGNPSPDGKDPKPTTLVFTVKKGDLVFVASDGIGDTLTNGTIEKILRDGGGIEELIAAVQKENQGGGRAKPDDVSITMIEIGGNGARQEARARAEEQRQRDEQALQARKNAVLAPKPTESSGGVRGLWRKLFGG